MPLTKLIAGAFLIVVASVTLRASLDTVDASSHEFEVRIVAQRISSGRTEFALQQRNTETVWGDRQLPRARFFPASTAAGRWLMSTSLHLDAPRTDLSVEARIWARKGSDGRIEFALQRRSADGDWAELELPRARFFPVTVSVGRWLASTPLQVPTPGPAPTPTPWATEVAYPQ